MSKGIIILPIAVMEELIQLKTAFDSQLRATDFVSETPSYLSLSDKCKEYMIGLQSYMFRSIEEKGAELRSCYQRQTVLQEAGDVREYVTMEEELEILKAENHLSDTQNRGGYGNSPFDLLSNFAADETTRAGRLLMAVGTSILRIQEKAENPEEMQKMVAGEVDASEAELVIFR
ncbi:hypothetical protein AJ78_08347 [Emergomyces pasteurianus Ep9510]|uniref:Uncharacterized protein n=1 Tax=Emergomyces pasteurianus Ep9510 TaxID=1447872 RepID=A0A1J9Q356_9EURO|nr:hypothetical protein AJ78_08347 [Emergomyces pasteurianus Ep9510]